MSGSQPDDARNDLLRSDSEPEGSRSSETTYSNCSQQDFRLLVEQSLEGVWIVDASGQTIYVNPQMARMLEYSSVADILGKSFLDFAFDDEEVERGRLLFDRRIRGVEERHVFRFRTKNGGELLGLVAGTPRYRPDGTFDGGFASIINISEHARVEREWQRCNQRYEFLLGATRQLVYDFDSIHDRVTYSGSLLHLLGYASNLGDRLEDWMGLVHPEDVSRFQSEMELMRSAVKPYWHRYRIRSAAGEYIHVEDKGQYLEEGRRAIGIVSDIEEKVRDEQKALEKERMAAAMALGSSLAHELNNPLAVLTNSLFLLKTTSGIGRHALNVVLQAEAELERITRITRQLLGLYAGGTSRKRLKPEEILEDSLAVVATKIAARRITIEKEVRLHGALTGFEQDMRKLFMSLISNADEHTPEGGTIRIRLYSTHARSGAHQRGIRFVVANSAPISPRVLNEIFRPFNSTKSTKGTGLGLWVTKAIVEKYGGVIRWKTGRHAEKSSTVFSVFIPDETGQAAVAT